MFVSFRIIFYADEVVTSLYLLMRCAILYLPTANDSTSCPKLVVWLGKSIIILVEVRCSTATKSF